MPGDYAAANTNIPNVTAAPACGGGACVPGDSQITAAERVFAWHHLTNAGFISCPVCSTDPTATAGTPGGNNSLVNAYNGFMTLEYSKDYAGSAVNVNHLKSGLQVPSNIMAEVDRKLDDGNPSTGKFRNAGVVAPAAGTCMATVTEWQSLNPVPSCEAVNLF